MAPCGMQSGCLPFIRKGKGFEILIIPGSWMKPLGVSVVGQGQPPAGWAERPQLGVWYPLGPPGWGRRGGGKRKSVGVRLEAQSHFTVFLLPCWPLPGRSRVAFHWVLWVELSSNLCFCCRGLWHEAPSLRLRVRESGVLTVTRRRGCRTGVRDGSGSRSCVGLASGGGLDPVDPQQVENNVLVAFRCLCLFVLRTCV